MKLTIESTEELAMLAPGVEARVWKGTTERGIEVYAFVACVAVDAWCDQEDFQRELVERPHRPDLEARLGAIVQLGDTLRSGEPT